MGWPNPNPGNPNTGSTTEQMARIDDLWHAAVNGRGQYFSAKDPTSLTTSLTSALSQIQARLSSAAAAATSTLEPTAGDNLVILPTYTTQEWTGELRGFQIDLADPLSATFGQLQTTALWSAKSKLDAKTKAACDNRKIKLFRQGATDNLVDFTWNSQACDGSGAPTGTPSNGLDPTEQAFFNELGATDEVQDLSQWGLMTDGTSGTQDQRTAARGANLVNFLRGQRGKEGTTPFTPNDLNKLYRSRKAVLGDVVNSQPLYVRNAAFSYGDSGYAAFAASVASRAPMVYVAANDGMLHAFTSPSDVSGGEEAWAFIPRAVLPRLYKLADSNYANLHEYFVDGRPVRDDVKDAGGTWRTILVGGLNKGGRGYYALDITDPTNPKALWEFSHSPSICSGAGQFSDCHLGFTFGNPVISKLAPDPLYPLYPEGRWVVFVTSGYNNVNTSPTADDGKGFLYVLDAMTGEILYKIGTGVGSAASPSGLSKITAWVNNADLDNTTSRVYGVDLLGNLWRFDVNNQILPAGRDAMLLATLKDPSGNPQPITVAPRLSEVGSPPVPFVFVATGKYMGVSDVTDIQVQSVYAIKDPLTATGYANLRTSLQTLTLPTGSARTVTCSAGCDATNGWFADLPSTGERVNVAMELQLGTLVVASNVPANTPCEPGGFGFLSFFAIDTGLPPSGSTVAQARYQVSGLTVGLSIVKLPDGTVVVYRKDQTGDPPTKEEVPIGSGAPSGKRVTWRELMQ
jgi:type IV pilus assembly protein PilY1